METKRAIVKSNDINRTSYTREHKKHALCGAINLYAKYIFFRPKCEYNFYFYVQARTKYHQTLPIVPPQKKKKKKNRTFSINNFQNYKSI